MKNYLRISCSLLSDKPKSLAYQNPSIFLQYYFIKACKHIAPSTLPESIKATFPPGPEDSLVTLHIGAKHQSVGSSK